MNEIKQYLKSREFFKALAYALGIFLVFMLFVATCTRIYTHHNQSYSVPDFSEMLLKDAIPIIEKKNLNYEIFDSIYIADKESGTILDQHPKPGFLIKKQRKIFLTITSTSPEKIAMPNLVGVTLREGKARLESFGLVLGILSYKYDISKNVILDQRSGGNIIQPGDSISKGTAIDLVLGKGLGDEREIVPNLVGYTVEQAKFKLADAMFSLGAIVPDGSYDSKDFTIVPKIYKQKPSSNRDILVPLGSTITVWVTADSAVFSSGEVDDEGNYILDELNENDETDSTVHTSN
jgi:eukaryotic-like serine/threonine-protein kinase